MNRFILVAATGLLLSACKATPPAKWAEGGAALEIPRARWALVETSVDLLPDGTVFVNSEHVLTIDRAGRVINADKEPVALLLPDGRVVGPDDSPLGNVGSVNASLPDEQNAWLSVMPTGEVIRYLEDGERMNFGAWLGCGANPFALQTCTLITHILGMRIKEEQDRVRAAGGQYGSLAPVGSGIGIGIP